MQFLHCLKCRNWNQPQASFCAYCGQRLRTAAVGEVQTLQTGVPPKAVRIQSSANSCCGGMSGLVWLMFAAGAAGLVGFAVMRHGPEVTVHHSVHDRVHQSFPLPADVAGNLYDLLKPDEVRVVVSRSGNTVRVRGTEREIDSLTRLVGLVTRQRNRNGWDVRRHIARQESTWTDYRRYHVDRRALKAMYNLLGPADVPLKVDVEEGLLGVLADNDDQRTVYDVVTGILHGYAHRE